MDVLELTHPKLDDLKKQTELLYMSGWLQIEKKMAKIDVLNQMKRELRTPASVYLCTVWPPGRSLLGLLNGSLTLGINLSSRCPCHPLPVLQVGKHGGYAPWFGCVIGASHSSRWSSQGTKEEACIATDFRKEESVLGASVGRVGGHSGS